MSITICCEAMLRAIGNRDVVVTTDDIRKVFVVTIRERSGNRINHCPFCGTKLPFLYEEAE